LAVSVEADRVHLKPNRALYRGNSVGNSLPFAHFRHLLRRVTIQVLSFQRFRDGEVVAPFSGVVVRQKALKEIEE